MGKGVVVAYCKCLLPVAHSVALDISLGDEVDAVLVAEFVPAIGVRIMAGTHSVYVELLHYLDVLNHTRLGHCIALVGVKLVAVCALEEDRLAVDEHLRVADLDFAEAHLDRDGLAAGACIQGIEVRGLGRPFERVLDFHRDAAAIGACACHFPAGGIPETEGDLNLALGEKLNGQVGVAVSLVEVHAHAYILNALLLPCIEVAVASHAAQAEEVLVFEVGSVAPAENLEGEEILLARLDVLGDVELGLKLAVLAVADELAVDPEVNV